MLHCLALCSPVLAGCLASCHPGEGRTLASLPIEGTYDAAVGMLVVLYSQVPSRALHSELQQHPKRLKAALELAHKYNLAGVLSNADHYFAKQYSPKHLPLNPNQSYSMSSRVKCASDWLKLACQIGMTEFQLCLEEYLIQHAGTFASLPEVAEVQPQAQQGFLESVLRILRGTSHKTGARIYDQDSEESSEISESDE